MENLYASPICLSNILSAEFKVSEINDLHAEYELCLQIFKSRFDEACTHLLEFNSWAKSRTIQEKNGVPPIKLFLNDATMDKLIDINLVCSTIRYDPNDIASVFKKADRALLCQNSVAIARDSFVPESRLSMFRGKQQLEMFRLFLAALKEDFLSAGAVVFNQKRKLKTDFASEDSDLMSELSQYAETPDCLRAFLRKQALVGAADN